MVERMEDELRSPVVERWMSFRVRLAQPLAWPRAAWAALCGALASGALGLGGQQLLSLVLVLVLVEPVWGTLWELALGTDWPARGDESPSDDKRALGALPYTVPGSPGYRLARWLGQRFHRWQTTLWPRTGSAVVGLFTAALLTVVLAIVLGRPVVAVSAAALVCIALAFFAARGGGRPPLWPRAMVDIGLAWLAGHLAFASLTWPSVALAVLYTGVLLTRQFFATGYEQPPRLGLSNALQVAVVVLLVGLRRPVLAGAVGLLLTPQWLMQPLLRHGWTRHGYLRRTEPLIMAAMLAAAVALA